MSNLNLINNPTNDALFNYLSSQDQHVDDRIRYRNKIKEINLLLSMNGFSEIGDLFETNIISINKTINVLQALLDDRQKILSSKSDLLQKISRTDGEYISMIEKTENTKEKIQEQNKKIEFLRNKISVDEKKFKENMEKLKIEKLDTEKSLNRLLMKDSQYKHEIKKNEKEIEELKNRIKKFLSEGVGRSSSSNNIPRENNFRDKSPKSHIGGHNQSNVSMNISSCNMEKSQITNESNLFSSCLPNFKLTSPINPLNSLLNDNSFKNSQNILHNINHLKEFYNLIYQAFNEKVSHLLVENEDLKDCYKLIWREVNQFIEYKKIILYKFCQDSIEELKNNLDQYDTARSIINFEIFDMDFSDSRDAILSNFSEVLNVFRFVLIYDILKVEPTNEFEYDELKKIINNKKFDFQSVPYYNQVKSMIESFDFSKFEALKNIISEGSKEKVSSKKENYITSNFTGQGQTSRRKSLPKDEVFQPQDISERESTKIETNKEIENLEEISREFFDTMNFLDDKLNFLEKEIEKVK